MGFIIGCIFGFWGSGFRVGGWCCRESRGCVGFGSHLFLSSGFGVVVFPNCVQFQCSLVRAPWLCSSGVLNEVSGCSRSWA